MRQIKLRVWDKDNKEMAMVRSIEWDCDYKVIYCDTLKIRLYRYAIDCGGNEIVLMQYTGLQDKAGTEIFESDILKHDLWGVSEVIWEHGCFRGTGDEHDITLADHQLQRSRVIGNVYEAPELLEDKK